MTDAMTTSGGNSEQSQRRERDLVEEQQEDSLLSRFQQRFPFWGAVSFWVREVARMGKYWVLGGIAAFILTSLITIPVFGVEPVVKSVVGLGQMATDGGRMAVAYGLATPWHLWFYAVSIYAVYLLKAEAKRLYGLLRARRQSVEAGILSEDDESSSSVSVRRESSDEWSGTTWQELLAYSVVTMIVGVHALAMSVGFVPSYLSEVPAVAAWVVFGGGSVVVAWAMTRTLDEDIEYHELDVAGSTFWLLSVRVPLLYCVFALLVGGPSWLSGMFAFAPAILAPVAGLGYVVTRQFRTGLFSTSEIETFDG